MKTKPLSPPFVGAWVLHWLGSALFFRLMSALFGTGSAFAYAAAWGWGDGGAMLLWLGLFLAAAAATMPFSCWLFAQMVHALTVKRWCERQARPVPARTALPYSRAWWSYFGGFAVWMLAQAFFVFAALMVEAAHKMGTDPSLRTAVDAPPSGGMAAAGLALFSAGLLALEFWAIYAWFRRCVRRHILAPLEQSWREADAHLPTADLPLPPPVPAADL